VLGYARDVTEIKEYEQEIEDQRDKLEILNHVLRHDVRNDLQLIGGYVDTLASQQDHQNKQEFIETIKKSVSHAVETTETARELADVMLSNQTGTEYVDLKAVLTTESSKINSSYPEVSINHETPIPSIQIAASEMISSVFFNILKNAVRHNDKEDIEIDIAVTENKETVTVHIADNGPGIPDSQKEAVFGKGEHGLKSPGTGMGLYLVDTLVTSYGGEVWIEDNDPEGAVFLVELPK
jgi:signal transduction histidine kinase